jgi:hypothetical protein
MKLADAVGVRARFARSVNVELDAKPAGLEGYLPTGRALDVVRRVARGLGEPASGRALSITGPHGTGKSSLAVFLDALCAPAATAEHRVAWEILHAADSDLAATLAAAVDTHGARNRGCIRATVTAEREPVTTTIARALHHGAARYFRGRSGNPVPAVFADPDAAQRLTSRDIRSALDALCARAPVLLVVDEFGKNLEAYAESSRETDPFLLQELAEWSQGVEGLPLVVVTMQHLAFDEYVQETSTTRRREWVKVQGRFEDIPYVETTAQARRLVAASFTRTPSRLSRAIDRWYSRHAAAYRTAGLRDLVDDPVAPAAYPLHPIALAVLPDLCSRYGQNERTLFSFLAGSEPLAVPALLATTAWNEEGDPPFVRLDRIYDYFVDSAATMIGSATTASRWVEIETRIRDTHGLTDPELRALKTVGVLNLISTGGALRASSTLLGLALRDGQRGTSSDEQVAVALANLEAAGLITYRDFADEYRIWQGSDFDLRTTVELARRRCQERPLAALLNEAAPLEPVVAGRHSQRVGTLRVFERRYSDLHSDDLTPPAATSPWDGTLLYATSAEKPSSLAADKSAKPVVAVMPTDVEAVQDAAVEAAALVESLRSAEAESADWVARRELIERVALARQRLTDAVSRTWDPAGSQWVMMTRTTGDIDARTGVSAALSAVCDAVYPSTPPVGSEMLARRVLTSQGAKARRMLLAAMLTRTAEERFGIEGYGPERAMYESVLRASGIHRYDSSTERWVLADPSAKAWKPAWQVVKAAFRDATERRVELTEIAGLLQAPPIGLKEGPIPVLILGALAAHAHEVAVYEHGTLVLVVDDAVAERLIRNPGHFSVKNTAATAGPRRPLVAAIAKRLGIASYRGDPTFLQVARSLYRDIRMLPAYSQQTTTGLSTQAVALRKAFRVAPEPDVLLFETIPELLGLRPFAARGRIESVRAADFAERLVAILTELRGAYDQLLISVARDLSEATGASGDLPEVRLALAGRAADLNQRVLEPRLKTFLFALSRDGMDDAEWVENVAMVVTDGKPPKSWTDDDVTKYRLNVGEVGGALRRVQALLFEHLANDGEGFQSVRAAFTRPDGDETVRVVTITDRERAELEGLFSETLAAAAERVGSRAKAQDLLLAWLAGPGHRTETAGSTDRIRETSGG